MWEVARTSLGNGARGIPEPTLALAWPELSAFTEPPAAVGSCQVTQAEHNTYHEGAELLGSLKVSTAGDCAELCISDPQCTVCVGGILQGRRAGYQSGYAWASVQGSNQSTAHAAWACRLCTSAARIIQPFSLAAGLELLSPGADGRVS